MLTVTRPRGDEPAKPVRVWVILTAAGGQTEVVPLRELFERPQFLDWVETVTRKGSVDGQRTHLSLR